jgi:hypothetical protein
VNFKHRLHIKRDLLIAVIISELLCISAFLLSPNPSRSDDTLLYSEPIILINNIQPTTQLPEVETKKPNAPLIYIADLIEEPELLDDVVIAAVTSKEEDSDASEDVALLETGFYSSAPRLTLEVLPDEKEDQISGSLNLSLKIGKDGKVISHKVIFSTLECENCMDKILSAVYRSKWQPALTNGIEVDYWVEKSYVF